MSNNLFAVVIDLISIQKYVFASNELKDNLGASFLVEEIYNSFLSQAYEKVTNKKINTENWSLEDYKENDPIGYIGGGNALIFFQKEDECKSFIKEFTKILLVKAPACNPITAFSKFDLDNFQDSKKKLFKKLRDNKAKYITQIVISRHGITTECSRTGLSAEQFIPKVNNKPSSYISMVSKAKINLVDNAKNSHEKYITDSLKDKFIFTDDLGKLGQKEQEKNHIAVVHIDGNNIGEKFKNAKTINETRKLSKDIKEITENSFKDLIVRISDEIIELSDEFDLKNDNYYTLPIRPIIIGGDDITFVCAGKLGIYFAKLFLEFFETNSKKYGYDFTACAGVSIVKTKYPFYKAYEIAEQACSSAKLFKKDGEKSGSWLDFHINSGVILYNLEEVKENHFKTNLGSLLFRPYIVSNEKLSSNYQEKSFNLFVQNTIKLKKDFPTSKIKELREVLTLGKDSIDTFINQQKARGNNLPTIPSKQYPDNIFQDNVNPYFDMMELIDFYPSFQLKGN